MLLFLGHSPGPPTKIVIEILISSDLYRSDMMRWYQSDTCKKFIVFFGYSHSKRLFKGILFFIDFLIFLCYFYIAQIVSPFFGGFPKLFLVVRTIVWIQIQKIIDKNRFHSLHHRSFFTHLTHPTMEM